LKQVLLKIFKGFLVTGVLFLAVLLVCGLVLLIGWPWWVGFFVLLGLAGLALGGWVLRKFLKRRREQYFVHQIVAQDEAAQAQLAPKEQDAAKMLQARWKEAVEALRKSHLRKYGNPLYVLPWYMVIGESGSGKTTAIESARLSSPFSEVTRTSGISGTRNCDWWFFDQSVIIDTAGRYAIPVDEGRDKDEWQTFLKLLSRFRKKEPLNGLVVTTAADRLAQNSAESLQEDGRSIRRRIDELMRVLGAKFPVYFLVTKCDLIQGATHFCNSLPEDALNQAMGLLNHDLSADIQAFINKTFHNLGDRLRHMRLLLLNKVKGRSRASAMLLFPEEFEKLKTPLTAFIQGALEENPYQETPLLRGLYFSSGRQEGTPFSNFLKALNLIQKQDVLAGTNKGLFLHDLFDKILPRDRRIFTPTQHMVQWRRLTRNMGLTAWVAVMVAVCGLLSYAFVNNLEILSDVRRDFNKPAILQGELLPDVITLDRFRQALIKVEQENDRSWIPRFGLRESLAVETALKHKFVTLFHSGFLSGFDSAMGERMARFDAHTPRFEYGAHVVHLVRRINLLKARLDRDDLAALSAAPQPGYDSQVLNRGDVIPEIQKKIGVQYLWAIAWEKDDNELNQELAHLQTWLKHLLTLPGVTLNWLADWANADPALASVGMHTFWGGQPDPNLTIVPAAFTRAGKAKIKATISEIEAALFNPLMLAEAKMEFNQWYANAYVAAWREFVQAFDTGRRLLNGRAHWQATAKTLNTAKGPYYALIDHAVAEFEPFGKDHTLPPWIALAKDWQSIRNESTSPDVIDPKKAGILRKAKRNVTSKIRSAENTFGVKAVRKPMSAQEQLNAAKLHLAYQSGLDESIKATSSQDVAFQMASEIYSQDPATGQSPLLSARQALTQIKAAMGDASSESETLFWDHLLGGNIRFMQQYINQETACMLQSRWETDVLMEVEQVSADQNMGQLMMGSGGFASEFIKGPAKPFVTRSYKKGYYAKEALGEQIPFGKDFLAYLTKGAQAAKPRKKSYNVKVRAYPTDTNPDAAMRPQSTLLVMQCADKRTRLENFNYPVAKSFAWSPQECGDVTFQISVGNLMLTKTYTGYNAFAKFLHAFKTGSHTFQRSDFPSEAAALRRFGINYIKVKYQFQGHRPALAELYSAPGRPPRKIVSCWE
jgi:type VI secretion system protein ImpL